MVEMASSRAGWLTARFGKRAVAIAAVAAWTNWRLAVMVDMANISPADRRIHFSARSVVQFHLPEGQTPKRTSYDRQYGNAPIRRGTSRQAHWPVGVSDRSREKIARSW